MDQYPSRHIRRQMILRDVGASSNVWTVHKADAAGRRFNLRTLAD